MSDIMLDVVHVASFPGPAEMHSLYASMPIQHAGFNVLVKIACKIYAMWLA